MKKRLISDLWGKIRDTESCFSIRFEDLELVLSSGRKIILIGENKIKIRFEGKKSRVH